MPWGAPNQLPIHVYSSLFATWKRKLLCEPEGGAWYLGERISVQSLQSCSFLIPKKPPNCMLFEDIEYPITHQWALERKPIEDFLKHGSQLTYTDYRNKFLNSDTKVLTKVSVSYNYIISTRIKIKFLVYLLHFSSTEFIFFITWTTSYTPTLLTTAMYYSTHRPHNSTEQKDTMSKDDKALFSIPP